MCFKLFIISIFYCVYAVTRVSFGVLYVYLEYNKLNSTGGNEDITCIDSQYTQKRK